MESISRRKLLREGTQALAVGVSIGSLSPANGSRPPAGAVDYYQKLGVTPLINAAGTYTRRLGPHSPPAWSAVLQ